MRVRKHDVAQVTSVADQYNYTARESAAVHADERDRRDRLSGCCFVQRPSSAAGDAFQFPLRGAEDDSP